MPIPEKHVQTIVELVRFAKGRGVQRLSGTLEVDSFNAPVEERWNAAITFSWERGRHGEVSPISISSNVVVNDKATSA